MVALNMGSGARQTLNRAMSEAEWMQQVMDYALVRKWLVYHTYDARRSHKGFPDLVLVRAGIALFAELKTERGQVSDEQKLWRAELSRTGNEFYIWRPSDWPEVRQVLL